MLYEFVIISLRVLKLEKTMKKINKIKSGFLSRNLSLAKLGLSAGTNILLDKLSKAAENSDNKYANFFNSQAELWASELGKMKGSVMKAGQMLSVYGEHFLPKEALEFLSSLQANSPYLDYEKIKPIIEKEVPHLLEQVELFPEPIGNASIGQVHKGIIKDTGEVLAIKIQYPKVDEAIDSDLKILKLLFKTLDFLPSNLNLDPLMAEIKEMLIQEMDYEKELQNTIKMWELIGDDPNYIVPKCFPELSSKKVLLTEFMPGKHLNDELIAELDQNTKNDLGISFLKLYLREVFHWGFVQTDPHYGNYTIFKDGNHWKWVLLDFGAIQELDVHLKKHYPALIKAIFEKDKLSYIDNSLALGILKDSDPQEFIDRMWDYAMLVAEPMHFEGIYDWGKTDLPQRILKEAKELTKLLKFRTPPQGTVFLDRKLGGTFSLISKLGSQFNANEIIKDFV